MTGNQAERSDRFIELPARMVLTSEGIKAFQKAGTPVQRVLNREGVPREGLEAPRFNGKTAQKLVMNSLLEEICTQLPDMLSRRYQIISTTNLIVYAILYKKLSPSLGKMMFESQIVRDFNRKNPKNSIVDLKHVNLEQANALFQKHPGLFEKIENDIRQLVEARIQARSGIEDEDRQAMAMSLPKFLAWIDRRIWFLYYVIFQTSMRDQMRNVFAGMIARYLEHTRLATHLSHLVMEFIQNAEKAHFERLIVRAGMAARDEVDKFLRDSENRKKVIAAAIKTKQHLDISWNMNPERLSVGQHYRVQITISNFGLIEDDVRDALVRKMKTNVDGIGISDFYTGGDGDPDKLGAGLGLLYNSYLEDLCKQEGINYRCSIYPEPRLEKTTVRIEMAL